MQLEDIIMVCCSDLSGQLRGKGFPARQLDQRTQKGVAWTPANLMITAFGPNAGSPWGPRGDLLLKPDLSTRVYLDFGDGSAPEHFILGNLYQTDGSPWACCLRHLAQRTLDDLTRETGLVLKAAFEHEFHYSGVEERPGTGYHLDAMRRQGAFARTLVGALREAGLSPDTFMPEFGPCQYEITLDPALGLRAADQAVLLREVVRATAWRQGARASFTPIRHPEAVGNGVHVHFSLVSAATEAPVNYDPSQPYEIAPIAAHFLAGILTKMPAIAALTAASTISYLRLQPNRWSATHTNFGIQDREAGLRLCPVFDTSDLDRAQQFHFEYRVADAVASPYLVLGAIAWAGLYGIRHRLPLPAPTTTDPNQLSAAEQAEFGITRLPQSLRAALEVFAKDADLRDWMGDTLHELYQRHKYYECDLMQPLSPEAQCDRYYEVY